MNSHEPSPVALQHPLARSYVFLCSGATAILLLVLMQRGLGMWAFVPVLIGVIGILTRWRASPLVLIAAVIIVQEDLWGLLLQGDGFGQQVRVSDLILAAAVLGYVGGHYRLQGLSRCIIPPDARYGSGSIARQSKALQRMLKQHRQVRSPQHLSVPEIILFLLALPVWSGVALLVWRLLPDDWELYNLGPHTWRALIFLWVLFVGMLAMTTLLGYLARLRMTRQEALQLLQDALWHETRGQQRWVSRWLAWFRLPPYHRKDLP